MSDSSLATSTRPRPWIHWRLFALIYDALPVIALWFVVAVPFVLMDVWMSGNVRHNIEPFSAVSWLLWLACWAVTGLYATMSWRRGGQTLGMRPWRLEVVASDGGQPSLKTLWLRFAVATGSLALGGLGFWWAWFDRERLTWHDRFSGTRVIRLPKR